MDDQELFALFRKNGYKATTQRLAIWKYIISRDDHPSTDQIYQAMKVDYPTISLGTIYKTLHLLKDLGLIQELGFNEGSVRYDPNTEFHINMICSKCGEIVDYESENTKKFWSTILSELEVKVNGHRFDVYYECDDCK